LTGLTKDQQILFGYGHGSNGKSVLFNTLVELLGDYATVTPTETFMMRGNEGPPPHFLAELAGVRLVVANEVSEGQRFAEPMLKALTGGEEIVARKLYGHPFSFRPQFKPVVVGNHKPMIRGTDTGIWRRLNLLPFNRTFEPFEQDRNLQYKLIKEMPGILNWAVNGCLLWQKEGRLDVPQQMLDSVNDYRTESDILGQWIDENCVQGMQETILASSIYADYRSWCLANGHHSMSQTMLGRRLNERSFTKEQSKHGRLWRGITIKQLQLNRHN
jgi:putative DNA primase/helicase